MHAFLTHLDELLYRFFTGEAWWWPGLLLLVVGIVASRLIVRWVVRMCGDASWRPLAGCAKCGMPWSRLSRLPLAGLFLTRGRCPICRAPRDGIQAFVELATPLLLLTLVLAISVFGTQLIPGGGGDARWFHWRILYQSILILLLVAATATDFKDYVIPDEITIPGMLLGVAGATAVGNLQFLPVWIDWTVPYAAYEGAYIPLWIKQHWHWHGLVWSLTGLIVGGGVTWIVRIVARWMLASESLGFGDVTLMAMIGSFIGWQPVVFVFLLAPIAGVVVGLAARWTGNTRILPFGPYLAAATVVVLFSFRWLWAPVRLLFGDPLVLVGASLGSVVGFVVLLGLVRLYRLIPVERRRRTP